MFYCTKGCTTKNAIGREMEGGNDEKQTQMRGIGHRCIYYLILLSFSHDFAKQEYTTYFGPGSKSALTQSILHGLA